MGAYFADTGKAYLLSQLAHEGAWDSVSGADCLRHLHDFSKPDPFSGLLSSDSLAATKFNDPIHQAFGSKKVLLHYIGGGEEEEGFINWVWGLPALVTLTKTQRSMGGVKSEFANLELSPGHPEGFIFFGFLGFWEAFKIGAFSITNPYGFVTFSAT